MGWTRADWIAYEARRNKIAVNSDGTEDENELHNEILEECQRRGWLPFHGSMAHKTYRTKGEQDFTIFADRGRVIAVEAKSKRGKLSTDQRAVIALAKSLGHTIHVISSFEEFLKICET